MKKTYACKVVIVESRELVIYVRADDIHDATDAADNFARKNLEDLQKRMTFSGRQLEAYSTRGLEVIGNVPKLDVEV
jgi:hypothetical protein